jgi:hypothetical protein
MPPKVYNCDIPKSACEKSSSLTKAGIIELALKCKAIKTAEEGASMSRKKLCELIEKKGGEGAAAAGPSPRPQSPRTPSPKSGRRSLSCDIVTDSICKKLKKDELVQLALKCKVIKSLAVGNSMSKIQLCDLLKKRPSPPPSPRPPSPKPPSGRPTSPKPPSGRPRSPKIGKRSPSCDNVTDADCKKMKKEELVQLALRCKVVENKTKGNSMNKNKLCDLLKKKPSPAQPRPPQPPPQPQPQQGARVFSKESIEEIERLMVSNTTKRQLKELNKSELNEIARKLKIKTQDRDVNDIVNDIVNVVVYYINTYVNAGQVPPQSPPPQPQPQPQPESPKSNVCYKGMTKAQLKSAKTKLSDLKAYADELGIKGVNTKSLLAEYICAAGTNDRCSADNNNCDVYCDITNGVCVPEIVGEQQVANSSGNYSMFEHAGKSYIGSNDAIKKLKDSLAGSPEAPAAWRVCVNDMTRLDLEDLSTSDLKNYASQMGIDMKNVKSRSVILDYLCSDSCQNLMCGMGMVCDLENNRCVGEEAKKYMVDNMNFIQTKINGMNVIGKQSGIDRLRNTYKVPTPAPVPVPEPVPAGEPEPAAQAGAQAGSPEPEPAAQAGAPSPFASPSTNLSEDDIENILDDITEGRKPTKLQQLSDVERSILQCLGIL